ncbi:MAG: hypothetical protein HGA87_00220 [Desulfobulbaceae bacterium]|nr:hypothetical protein [Desulfobulbaceae bacterium]
MAACAGSTAVIQSDGANHTYTIAEEYPGMKVFAPSPDKKKWIPMKVDVTKGDILFTKKHGQPK